MQIIVVGCGKMGMELANRLVAEGHDVTVIDRSEAVLEHCLDTLDVMTVKGSGVSFDALTEADVKHADIVIASTMSDETNMLTWSDGEAAGREVRHRAHSRSGISGQPVVSFEGAVHRLRGQSRARHGARNQPHPAPALRRVD